jgi:hypothetical protein
MEVHVGESVLEIKSAHIALQIQESAILWQESPSKESLVNSSYFGLETSSITLWE